MVEPLVDTMFEPDEAAAGPRAGPLVSVIIVLFNSAGFIGPCVESLSAMEYGRVEVIIVDNASRDGSSGVARESASAAGVECIVSELGRNRGFAAANNHAFGLSRGEILLLLNPDTEVYPDTVSALVRAFEARPDMGIAGCKIYYPDRRTIQHAGGFIRDNGLTMHYGADTPDEGQFDEPRDVAYVTGAALAVRRDVFREAGLLDEGYFPAYFEETDLCVGVRRMGYRVVYLPEARVIHHESTTTGKYSERFFYLYHRNRVRFLLKNFSWRFLLERSLPFEQRWLGWIDPEKEAVPLNKAYLANLANLPRTLLARRALERRMTTPRIEDTVGIEETMREIGLV